MDSRAQEWWRRHGWTLGLLLIAFGFAFAIRTIWSYPVIQQFGALYTYAGGSDSYYHSRVMTYIIQTHRNLMWDPMLKFPTGAGNPREPLFDWMNALLGIVFAPLFGGNAINAGAWFLDLDAPLWAALCVFPIYLIGREVSGRRAGLLAALVYPFFSASIDFTTFGYADYQSFYTFFLLVVVYAYVRTLKATGQRRWVESYRHPRQILPALRGYLRTERTAVKWSVFTGVALGAFGLAWQGYTYGIVVIAFTTLVAMIVERVRHVDSFGLYVSTWLIGLVGFAMVSPYYIVQGDIRLFLELPIILYFGTLLLMLPFHLMRDVPWVFSIPTLVAVVGAGILGLRLLSPVLFTDAITGNGYFVKTLIYTTVAEAQAPSIDALIVAYGVVTFFLAFAGLALLAFALVRQRFKRHIIAILIFAVVSVYLPISASKFFPVGAPAFALLAAEGIHRLLDVGGYPQLRRAVASLSDRRGSLAAFRKTFKARHVLVLALAVGILLPNIWISVDAGIPSNSKTRLAEEINHTLPNWIKLNQSAPADSYLGAAGTGLDTSNQYDSAGYRWLSQQDTNIPEPQRPALVAWWDYGFQTIDEGQHPSVADNFQNGIDPAGQFLLAQNESLAIAVLITTLLQGEITATHEPTLPGSLNSLLSQDGVNVTALHHYLDNGPADYQLVVHNPLTYLPVDPRTITDDNAMYLATSYYLASHLSLTAVAQVYDAVEAYTGWSIRYAMTDSRTFPFSGSDTGIFYAPADLTGRVINSEGVPSSFYNVTILGTDGNTYPLGPLPAGVGAAQYNIGYYPAFFDTMLYRIYIGYNGTDVGQSGGIPGLSGAAQGDPLEPGWMLQHFEIEYMTAYVCPGVKNASAGAGCMVATNRPAAVTIANQTNGTDDLSAISYFEGGESILAYYPGVTLEGRVALPGGGPVAGVRVTVYDGWGIPHMTSLTNGNGTFSLVLPPGNDTLELSYGPVNALTMAGSTQISRIKFPVSGALGYDTSPATLYQTFTVLNSTVSGVTFWNVSRSSSYNPSVDPVVRGAQVVLTDPTGEASFTATTDASGTFVLSQVPPGLYNVTVRVGGQTYNESAANVSSGGTVNLTLGLTPGTLQGTVLASGAPYVGATVTLRNATGGFVTVTTGTAGAYNFSGLAPGTYRVSAVGTTPTLVSAAVQVAITGPGANASANLTLAYAGTARVVVSAQGVSLPNATVTFTSQVSFSSSSTSPVEAVRTASANSTFAVTGASGAATVSLPVGYYSVYATSRIGSTLYVGLSGLNISGPGATATTSLVLTPARSLTVTVSGTSPGLVYTPVLAYGVGGVEVTDWAGGNNSAIFELPSGPYTVLALNGALTSGTNASAGLASVNVSGPTFVPVPLSPSVRAFFTVGTPGAQDQILSAANATVTVSVGLTGPRLEETASSSGAVAFLLPSSAPGASGGYCLNASAFGFASASTCGLSANELAGLTSFALAVDPVPVTLTVVGLPSGTSVRVNLTGETIGTSNLSLVGGPTFGFSLTPGVYGVGARAEIGHGTTVYLPSSVLSTEIPIGATSSNLTLVVVPEINASGKLTLPSGYPLGSVTIALASPILNVTVNGTAYTKSFRATPGTYTATVTASQSGVTYVNVSRVTLAADGTISPRLVLSQLGTVANVTLAAPNGASLAISPTVSLVTPTGLTILEHATSGFFSATLPPGTYQVYANGTTEVSGPNGTYLENWTTGPSASCTFPLVPVACRVTLAGTIVTVSVRGVLVPAGGGASVPGTVRLVGPFPSTNLTVLSAPNGSFSARLLPGAYDVYAVSNSGPPLAAFGDLLALPAEPLNISIGLESTWIDSVHLTLPNASGIVVAPATVRVQDVFGDATTFPGQGVGSVLPLALPVGSYTVSANASGTLNGVASSTTISRTVSLLAGNLLTELPISFPLVANVTAALTGPSSATVSAGGQATFDFVVRNTGNIPVTVHPVGSPSTWTFAFSFANRTVAPGANFSAGVRITVPVGTIVDHPPVSIVFDLPNGTQAGELSPAATVKVLGYYGLAAGTIPSVPPQVGSDRALLPFYVTNTGNTLETVLLTVVDAGRLASDGWTTSWSTTAPMTSGQVSLAAGQNLSVSVNLTASSAFLLPPGTVEVETSVVQTNGSITSSFVLHVPRPAVMTSSGTLVVTGPSVQSGPSSLPAWFIPLVAFVPALLLIVGVVTYRWWRTRRWTRR